MTIERELRPMSSAFPHMNPHRSGYYRSDLIDTMTGVDRFLREEFDSLLPVHISQTMCKRIVKWDDSLTHEDLGRILGRLNPESRKLNKVPSLIKYYGEQVRDVQRRQNDPELPDLVLRASRIELAMSVMTFMRVLYSVYREAENGD